MDEDCPELLQGVTLRHASLAVQPVLLASFASCSGQNQAQDSVKLKVSCSARHWLPLHRYAHVSI